MSSVATTLAQAINDKVLEAESKARGAMECALEAGALLVQAKEQVAHGQWENWLRENCTVAPRTARSYMKLATAFPALPDAERQRVADLPLREAVKAIATDPVSPPREKRIGYISNRETRNKAGETFQRAAEVARDAAKRVRIGSAIGPSKAASLIKSLEAALEEIRKLQDADNIVEAG
ncbi:DUF3102 domain-containing protein [Diaphorobacter caeni]|uniref:DUF3102 domain-containing protein n=1 Tax=Diaphorobacter caeni TaxID=2784387 RepID=UPI0018901286|nr:DUF3102 domain-containing protein [Diaphorobacter caeni]MBF5004769.1 DUF3102 domain-containing protein [Diaphorobacter caeni]